MKTIQYRCCACGSPTRGTYSYFLRLISVPREYCHTCAYTFAQKNDNMQADFPSALELRVLSNANKRQVCYLPSGGK